MFKVFLVNKNTSFLFIVLLLASCTKGHNAVYDTAKLTELYKHQEFIAELEKNNVDFYLNQDGSVSYNTAQTDLVDSITMTVLKKYSNGIHVFNSDYEKLITDELLKKEILFKVVIQDNDRWIMWDEDDHQKAQVVLKGINSRVYRKEIQTE